MHKTVRTGVERGVIFWAGFLDVLLEVPAWPWRGPALPGLVFGQLQLVCREGQMSSPLCPAIKHARGARKPRPWGRVASSSSSVGEWGRGTQRWCHPMSPSNLGWLFGGHLGAHLALAWQLVVPRASALRGQHPPGPAPSVATLWLGIAPVLAITIPSHMVPSHGDAHARETPNLVTSFLPSPGGDLGTKGGWIWLRAGFNPLGIS